MNAIAIVESLRSAGIRLTPDGDQLRLYPQSSITIKQIEQVRQHKPDILKLLQDEQTRRAKDFVQPDSATFDWIADWLDSSQQNPGLVCRCHQEQKWWRSVYGDHLICTICHPPAYPGVVADHNPNTHSNRNDKKAGAKQARY